MEHTFATLRGAELAQALKISSPTISHAGMFKPARPHTPESAVCIPFAIMITRSSLRYARLVITTI
jgi:hypothetical protein